MTKQDSTEYQFSFGPWNINEGADPFGPPVRIPYSFGEKIKFYKA
jgi:xylose isomerase